MILWQYQDNGFTHYRIIANGDNCDECTALNGKVFPIAEATDGENLPTFHPNCDCKIEIIDEQEYAVSPYHYKIYNEIDYLKSDTIDKFVGPLMKKSDEDNKITDIVECKLNIGKGLGLNLKVADIGIEIGGKRYYEYSVGKSVTENLSFSLEGQITDNIQVGISATGTVDATTRKHLQNSGYAGIKLGNFVIGWNNSNKSDDVKIAIELEGYLGVGGGICLEINFSELIKQFFN